MCRVGVQFKHKAVFEFGECHVWCGLDAHTRTDTHTHTSTDTRTDITDVDEQDVG
jgi:hypothetical protein